MLCIPTHDFWPDVLCMLSGVENSPMAVRLACVPLFAWLFRCPVFLDL